MRIIHNIGDRSKGSNYNTWDEIEKCGDDISCDGVYTSIWENRFNFDKLKCRKILFVMGKYIGKDNSFDTGMPRERYCDWDQLYDLYRNHGFELGYHSWSHQDLRTLDESVLYNEIRPPFPGIMKVFAPPYGHFDERVLRMIKYCGYKESFNVFEGDGSPLQQKRKFINW